jgi:exopolysaccharide biosynthesis polyprenyl glycosylphosphotransferase
MPEGYVSESPSARGVARDAVPAAAPAADERLDRRRGVAEFMFLGRSRGVILMVADAILLLLGNIATIVGAPGTWEAATGGWLIWLLPPLVIAVFASWGLYRDRIAARLVDGIGQVIAGTALPAVALIAGVALFSPSSETASVLARAWLFGTVYVVGGRLVLAWARRRARAGRLVSIPTLIVGAGQIGSHVERRLQSQPQLGLHPVGYLDSEPPPADMVPDRQSPVLGGPDDLGRVVEETGARHVVLGFSTAPDRMLIPLVRECEARGLQVSIVPRLFESVNVRLALEHLGGLPLFGLHSIDPKGWQFAVKHVFDRLGAAGLLLMLSPLLIGLMLSVRLSSPGPLLFRQWRIGRDGRRFQILKFRSMRMDEDPVDKVARDSNVVVLPTDIAPGGIEGVDRRTRIGTFMRRTSLDELPQLINVLRGEMSLIGPRPERPEFVDLFGSRIERYGDRHRVKSGVTGWAQVNGLRGKTSMRDRVEWDNYYIENWSLSLDLKILILTVGALFTGSRDA